MGNEGHAAQFKVWKMKRFLTASAFAASAGTTAYAVPMTFDGLVETATGYHSTYGAVVLSNIAHFTGVAVDGGTTVDVRVTATVKAETDFAMDNGNADTGYIPDYKSGSTSGPEQDLAFRFYGNNINTTENGVKLTFDFFDGTGAKSGQFNDLINVSQIDFAIYDVDGETYQSEFFRAYKSDGLASYRLGNTPQALVATQQSWNTYRFDGPNTNFSETDAAGAAILTYLNTSSFTIDFGSVQNSGPTQNAVFTAMDGDLSMFDLLDFEEAVELPPGVPLPAGLPLILSGLGGLAWIRRRKAVS